MQQEQAIILWLTILYFNPIFSMIAYDCRDTMADKAVISITEIMDCQVHNRNITQEKVIIQLVQPKVFEKIEVKLCNILALNFLSRCGKSWFQNSRSAIYSEVKEVSQHACSKLFEFNIYEPLPGKFIENLQKEVVNRRNMVTAGRVDSQGDCNPGEEMYINGDLHDRPIRTTEFTITYKTVIAQIDIETGLIVFPSGVRCTYTERSCYTGDEGYGFWSFPIEKAPCADDKKFTVLYEGEATKISDYTLKEKLITYTFEAEGNAFALAVKKPVHVCHQKAYQSEHPKLTFIEKNQDVQFILKYNPKLEENEVNIMTYMNSKLLFVVKHIQEQVEEIYDLFRKEHCKLKRQVIQNSLAIATINPLEFAYQFFQGPGYTALVRGDVIYITKCVAKHVTLRKVKKCFNDIPVTYNNESYFVATKNRILSQDAVTIDCNSFYPPIYKMHNDEWYAFTTTTTLAKAPQILDPNSELRWEFKKFHNLASSGIYNNDDLDRLLRIVALPTQQRAIENFIYRSVHRDERTQSFSLVAGFTAEDFEAIARETSQDFWVRFKNATYSVGNFCSFIIGVIILIKVFIFFIDALVNGALTYILHGFSYRLLLCWWGQFANLFLGENRWAERIREAKEAKKARKKQQNVNEKMEMEHHRFIPI